MKYEELNHEDFDAIVTGELTHFALWLEDAINGIICEYFIGANPREDSFRRLILYRDGLTFQDKLEIAHGIIPLLGDVADQCGFKSILKRIEGFKSWRNVLAHGLDVSDPNDPNTIVVEVVSRSGKEKRIEITPDSHREMIMQTEALLKDIQDARAVLRSSYNEA